MSSDMETIVVRRCSNGHPEIEFKETVRGHGNATCVPCPICENREKVAELEWRVKELEAGKEEIEKKADNVFEETAEYVRPLIERVVRQIEADAAVVDKALEKIGGPERVTVRKNS